MNFYVIFIQDSTISGLRDIWQLLYYYDENIFVLETNKTFNSVDCNMQALTGNLI